MTATGNALSAFMNITTAQLGFLDIAAGYCAIILTIGLSRIIRRM